MLPGHRAAAAAIALAGVTGLGLLAAGATRTPPRPPRPDAAATTDPTAHRAASPAPPLPRADPTRITIPAIGVRADLVPVAVTGTGELEVPPPDRPTVAGWYRLGVSPGEAGNAVIVGHVDSRDTGPAVFFDLGRLRPGDRIRVARADATEVTFAVDGIGSYPKTAFPADLVYGAGAVPRLRLVTCGGRFDERQGGYLDNVVVFATAIP
ncbi:class F sortase [Micromonospora olivasterospora]|uniref:Sortase family protein n=1 Tax=Micromonospora olivasterospora TaxID=1880 RepID=A0A562IHD0_MICOL|nr:class F sortase [Micromonospora olivasterospora]TWH70350.1 sortase family protein [Micromonospora olivasterospora]